MGFRSRFGVLPILAMMFCFAMASHPARAVNSLVQKTVTLHLNWKPAEVEFVTPPTLIEGWYSGEMSLKTSLEVPTQTADFKATVDAVRELLAPEKENDGLIAVRDGASGPDPKNASLLLEPFRFKQEFLEDDGKNVATIRGRATIRSDSKSVFILEHYSNNIDFDEPDPARRLERIEEKKPEERDIYSKGDASHLHRFGIRAEIRFVPNAATRLTRIEVIYRQSYLIYTANAKLLGIRLGLDGVILGKAKKATSKDMKQAYGELLQEMEKGLTPGRDPQSLSRAQKKKRGSSR